MKNAYDYNKTLLYKIELDFKFIDSNLNIVLDELAKKPIYILNIVRLNLNTYNIIYKDNEQNRSCLLKNNKGYWQIIE